MDTRKEQQIKKFEDEVMTALLTGDDPILEVLRKQYALGVKNETRSNYNESGFNTVYDLPADAPVIEAKQYRKNKGRKRPFHYHFYLNDVMIEFPCTELKFRAFLFLSPRREKLSFMESGTFENNGILRDAPVKYSIYYVYPVIENDKMVWKETRERRMDHVRDVWWNIWSQRKPRISIYRIKKWLKGYPGNPFIPD